MDQQSYVSDLSELPSIRINMMNPESQQSFFEKGGVEKLPNQFLQVQSELISNKSYNHQYVEEHKQNINLQPIPQLQPDQNEVLNIHSFSHAEDISEEQSQSVSYLNISFQEIVHLLLNNESPPLQEALRRSIKISSVIVLALLIYVWVELILETFQFYKVMQLPLNKVNRFEDAYFLLKCISDSLLLYLLSQVRYAINDSAYLGQGEVRTNIIEFLKYTIRNNSPFDEDESDDEAVLTQAQWVAKSIAYKIDTLSWFNYLINYSNGHSFSIARIIIISQAMTFLWGNAILTQDITLHSYNSIIIMYSLIPGYLTMIVIGLVVVGVIISLPIMILLLLWQTTKYCIICARNCCWQATTWYYERSRRKFLQSLQPVTYNQLKSEALFNQIDELCFDDNVIPLPCNVALRNNSIINHYFHANCITVWVENQGNCPVCRKKFFHIVQDD